MKVPVSILAGGVTSPGGTGPDSLSRRSTWPVSRMAPLAGGRGSCAIATIDLNAPPVNRWRSRPRLRRASPLTHHLVEVVSQVLEAHPGIDRSRVGIAGSFFLGCLRYSVRFFEGILDDGRRFASPILFPETVLNTPLSHVVSELGIGGPVYSQTGDTSCWNPALRTALTWITNGDADHVVVTGAEEFDQHELDAVRAAGWLRGGGMMRIAEGAGALLIGRGDGGLARIRGMTGGHACARRSEAEAVARKCLGAFDPGIAVVDTANGWMRPPVERALDGMAMRSLDDEPRWEAFTASCAWNMILAAMRVRETGEDLVVPQWGLGGEWGAVWISPRG
jgi:hypothetical protein